MAEEFRSWADVLASMGKAIVTEAIMPAVEKMVPQGAAELGQALYTGNGYMPYGATERPMDSPIAESAAIEPAVPQTEGSEHSFQQLLDGYAARGRSAGEQNKEMDR